MSSKQVVKASKPVVKTTQTGAVAVHSSSSCDHGDSHAVVLFNLKVMVTKEEGYWFAQCLEIDYFVDGQTKDDVKKRFEEGLSDTIDLHLKEYGSLEKLLRPAPSRVLMDFNRKFTRLYSQVSTHFHEHKATIEFYEGQEEEAA